MILAGITGGIGSGKSYVSNIFRHLGVPVFEADAAGKKLLDESPEIKKQIHEQFGDAVFDAGEISRQKLASIVFSDPQKLKYLNEIIHPAVQDAFNQWRSVQSAPYVLKEAAILIESGTFRDLDKLILVTAPEDTRIARVIAREGTDEASVRRRMAAQMPDSEKLDFTHFIIDNSEGMMLIPQVLMIHETLLDSA